MGKEEQAIAKAILLEYIDLSKSFEDNKNYKGYMVKQVISSRVKWVSENGRVHIGASDLEDIAKGRQMELIHEEY